MFNVQLTVDSSEFNSRTLKDRHEQKELKNVQLMTDLSMTFN